MSNKTRTKRISLALFYICVLYWIGFVFQPDLLASGFFISLIITPTCIGAMVQAVFDPDNKSTFLKVSVKALLLTIAFASISVLVGVEALLCVVMSIPIFIPTVLLGVFIARAGSVNTSDTTLKASLVLLPLLAIPAEAYITYPTANYSLRSEISINAPPETIWQHTVEIPEIQPEERIWTFAHMILRTPHPISAELFGDTRVLKWTKGVRFQEIVTDREENQRLAWRFNFNDPDSLAAFDPHVSPNSDALKVSDGFYEITPLGDGTSLLVLETHYRVSSPFNAYLGLWGDLFLTDFHNSVLAVIKSRSEGAI